MKELIELLNKTDGNRLFGYCLVFLISLYICVQGLVYIMHEIFRKR